MFEKKKAREDIRELTISIITFHETYGTYPIADYCNDEQSGMSVMDILVGKKDIMGFANSEEVAKNNPKLINFSKFFINKKTINGMILDPWETPYHIAFDTNKDGITEISALYENEEKIGRIKAPFVIWSNGASRKNELGGSGNITSWKDSSIIKVMKNL